MDSLLLLTSPKLTRSNIKVIKLQTAKIEYKEIKYVRTQFVVTMKM